MNCLSERSALESPTPLTSSSPAIAGMVSPAAQRSAAKLVGVKLGRPPERSPVAPGTSEFGRVGSVYRKPAEKSRRTIIENTSKFRISKIILKGVAFGIEPWHGSDRQRGIRSCAKLP